MANIIMPVQIVDNSHIEIPTAQRKGHQWS